MKNRKPKQQPKKWKITDILKAIAADPKTAAIPVPGRGGFTRGGEAAVVVRGFALGVASSLSTPEEWVAFWHFSIPVAVGLPALHSLVGTTPSVEEVLAALVAEAERLNVPRDA